MAISRLLRRSNVLLNYCRVARSNEHERPLLPPHHRRWDARHRNPFSVLAVRDLNALSLPNICDTHEIPCQSACKDYEILEGAVALKNYIQETAHADFSVAAAVVDHAPSFVKHLVATIKQEADIEEKLDAGDSGSMFSKHARKFLDTVGINVLEPVVESTGISYEHLQKLLANLSPADVNMQCLFSLIGTFEKLGVCRSSVGSILLEDLQVLSYSSKEIEVGFRTLEGLMFSKDELLSLIQRYPLILKTELVNNIGSLCEDLREFVSKDHIVKKAVFDHPQRVHTYRKGCATEVVDFLKSYEFTVKRLDHILQKHARLVLTDVEKKLRQNVQFLENLGLSKDLIYKVINRCPNFLFYSVDDNLTVKLEYFKELGFDETEFCKVISRYPNIFSASLDNKVKPAIAELRTLGLSEEGLKKVVLYRPCLFGYKLGGDIAALVKQLNESSYPEDKKVTAFIKLYSRGTEHKKKCEDCLVQYGLSIEEAKELLEKEPGILGYNKHGLVDKLESLTNTFGIPIQNVLAVPQYLSFGLRNRVQRRQRVLSYMKSRGLPMGVLNLKQLVLLSNSHFYNAFVKSHSEDKELSKIWFKDPDNVCIMSDGDIRSSVLETSSGAEAS